MATTADKKGEVHVRLTCQELQGDCWALQSNPLSDSVVFPQVGKKNKNVIVVDSGTCSRCYSRSRNVPGYVYHLYFLARHGSKLGPTRTNEQ
jgi:hypothetical protein